MNEIRRDTLEKQMTFKDYFFLAFGIYAGVGWVTTIQAWLSDGPGAGMLGFALCGILLIPVGLVYNELTLALPVTGGSVAFAYRAFGKFSGTITGWFLALGYIMVCPLEAVSVAMIIDYMFPVLNVLPLYEVMGFTIYLPSVIIGVAFTLFISALNYFGVQPSKVFQTITASTIGLIVIGLMVTVLFKGDFGNLQPIFSPDKSPVLATLAVLGLAPFYLAGFEAIPQMAEEAKDSKSAKRIGKAMIMAIIVGIFFYSGVTFMVSMSAPWQDTIQQFLPTAYAFETTFGSGVKMVVLAACFFGLLSTWNGCLMAGSRALFAMGRGRLLPKFFGEAHPKYKTPYKPVIAIGILTAIAPFIGKPVLLPVMNVGSFAFVVAWFMVCISAIKLRKSEPDLNRPYKMPGGLTIPIIGTIICGLIGLSMLIPGAPAALAWPVEWIVLAIWIVLGVICWYIVSKGVGKEVTDQQQRYLFFGDLDKENKK